MMPDLIDTPTSAKTADHARGFAAWTVAVPTPARTSGVNGRSAEKQHALVTGCARG